MEEYSKLLTGIAALIAAIAWPVTFLVVVLIFKSEIRSMLTKIPTFFDRVKKAKFPGLALELDRVADAEVHGETGATGKISPRQFEAAARIAAQVSSRELLGELDNLCLEYDALRRRLPSGEMRTRTMGRIIVKMRSLAPSLIEFIDLYKGSGSAGSRLAAVAMMQMVPSTVDLEWLSARFSSEQPFVFYHAALALENYASNAKTEAEKQKLRSIGIQALAQINNFSGPPDRGTIDILKSLIASTS
jgi:hypothetical protein